MPFERKGFHYSGRTGSSGSMTGLSAYVRSWIQKCRDLEQEQADNARICECGAATHGDQHTPTCWARPLRPMRFEESGFQVSKPLPYKSKRYAATRWFEAGECDVLPLTNSLFKALATRKAMYQEEL